LSAFPPPQGIFFFLQRTFSKKAFRGRFEGRLPPALPAPPLSGSSPVAFFPPAHASSLRFFTFSFVQCVPRAQELRRWLVLFPPTHLVTSFAFPGGTFCGMLPAPFLPHVLTHFEERGALSASRSFPAEAIFLMII